MIHQDNRCCPSRPGAGRASRGLTLIELMVVGSGVTLLAGFMLPAAMHARQQSMLSTCLDNLRVIAQAGLTYAEEDQYENAIPAHPSMFRRGATMLDITLSRFGWGGKAGVGPTVAPLLGTDRGMGPATRPLNRIIYKTKFPDYQAGPVEARVADTRLNLDIYRCPGDDGYPGGVSLSGFMLSWSAGGSDEEMSAYDYFGNSYTAAQTWVHWIGCNPHPFLMSNTVFLRPLSRVPNPARTIMYRELAAKDAHRFERVEDNDPCDPCRAHGTVYDRNCASGAFAAQTASGWHNRPWHFSHAFADGHLEFLRVKGVYCEDVVGFTGSACCGCQGDPSSENCMSRRAVQRGPRWQLDCLPSAPIRTDVPSDCLARERDGREPGGALATGLSEGL